MKERESCKIPVCVTSHDNTTVSERQCILWEVLASTMPLTTRMITYLRFKVCVAVESSVCWLHVLLNNQWDDDWSDAYLRWWSLSYSSTPLIFWQGFSTSKSCDKSMWDHVVLANSITCKLKTSFPRFPGAIFRNWHRSYQNTFLHKSSSLPWFVSFVSKQSSAGTTRLKHVNRRKFTRPTARGRNDLESVYVSGTSFHQQERTKPSFRDTPLIFPLHTKN